MRRGAIVIAVSKTGDLPFLAGAEAEATVVAEWLVGEDYDVSLLTDKSGTKSVSGTEVEDAFERFVTLPASYDFLLVYFTGHGAFYGRSDHWLLTEATKRSTDIINVREAQAAAEVSGIPNVVLVSDCCRTPEENVFRQMAMSGISGFPLHPEIDRRTTDVDTIECGAGQEALELRLADSVGDERRASALTEAWRRSYRTSDPNSIAVIETQAGQVKVVPNRRLPDLIEEHLFDVLDEADKSGSLIMDSDVRVISRDNVFIARAESPPPTMRGTKTRRPTTDTIADRSERVLRSSEPVKTATELFSNSETASARLEAYKPNLQLRLGFESGCGFVLPGQDVLRVSMSDPNVPWATADEPDPDPAMYDSTGVQFWHDEQSGAQVVRVWPGNATSVVITLRDRRSMVLPALAGFIGHVVVDDEGVQGISWVPSEYDWRHDFYQMRRAELDTLRAAAALAINANRFVVDDDEAASLADRIRVDKGLDPTLGLFAAYAYSQGGLDDRVHSVFQYMERDGTAMFDIGLLAARTAHPDYQALTPFCPVLTQGWNLLRSRQVPRLDRLLPLRPHLIDSLITTFDEPIADQLHDHAMNGTFL